jgi:phosphatidylglycerophosphatase A
MKDKRINWEEIKKAPFNILIISFFGVGLIPVASGTFGSIAAIPLIDWAVNIQCCSAIRSLIIVAVSIFFLGWGECIKFSKRFGKHDPSYIVIDEVLGMLTIFIVVFSFGEIAGDTIIIFNLPINKWIVYLLTFGIFRYFDIKKPWIIGKIDTKIDNAFGVMFDDVAAGLFSSASILIPFYLISLAF